jgi:protein-S-isoprenylcysteine O-methyltransferase Ste14
MVTSVVATRAFHGVLDPHVALWAAVIPAFSNLPSSVGAGVPLSSRAHLIALTVAFLVLPLLLARMRAEETLLRTQFGDEHDAYCRRRSRLIPGLY